MVTYLIIIIRRILFSIYITLVCLQTKINTIPGQFHLIDIQHRRIQWHALINIVLPLVYVHDCDWYFPQ